MNCTSGSGGSCAGILVWNIADRVFCWYLHDHYVYRDDDGAESGNV